MKYPLTKFRVSSTRSCQSCQSNSIANTTLTTLSESKDSTCDNCQNSDGKSNEVTQRTPEEDHVEGLNFLAERDMRSLHKHIPALGRRDVQMSGIRQHFYPEGGWGWVVVFCSFLAQCLTTGILLSSGMFNVEMIIHFHPSNPMKTIWVVVTAWSMSLALSPIITHVCRENSIRLVAVVGGLIMNLAFLFASFGHQLHQVFLSYSILFALGCCAVKEASSLMVGQYFKARRELVEMFVLSGPGLGIILFSLLYKQSIRSLRWRLGLQAMLSLTILAFFLGLFFRPASLYHPQRDAISHIKHQKEKVKGINTKEKLKQKKKASLLLDISFMRNRSIRIFLVCSSISSLGIYTPLFYLPYHMFLENAGDISDNLLLLQLWLGLSTCFGCLLGGGLTIVKSRSFFISKRYLLQFSQFGAALSMFSLYSVKGFYGYVMCACLYGLFFGCYLYSSKIFCYSIVKTKEFSRTWSLVQACQALPSLLGITITGYINQDRDKTGYWFSLVFVILGSCLLSLLHVDDGDAVLHTVPAVARDNRQGAMLGQDLSHRFNLGDFEDANNLSMSCNSKVDKFLVGGSYEGDLNGNVKSQKSDLHFMSALSHSDPEGLNSPGMWKKQDMYHPVSILKRQATWHKLLSTNQPPQSPPLSTRYAKVLPRETDLLVIDQITSTV